MLSSLLRLGSCLMLLWVSSVLLLGGSLACWLGISTWSPPKSLAWQKGFRLGSGLICRVLWLWLRVSRRLLLARVFGMQLVVIAGTSLLVVLLRLLLFFLVGFRRTDGLPLILLFGSYLIAVGGVVELRNLFNVHPFGLLLGCLLLIKVGVPSRLRFRGFGRFVMRIFSYVPSGCFAA